ncbi:MAG: cyclic nucleotide-binding domain-containing protein [Deltaproteobacteria bacterium]|nr:cyclic nucleotide-binding domain-containing protein [Deltaproteobacteria bacterium]
MDPAFVDALEPYASEVKLATGQVVVWEGVEQDAFYVVLHGRLSVTQRVRGELESVLAELGPGATFGELAVIDAHPAAATVTAEERSVLWRVDREGLHRLVGDPGVAWVLLKALAGKVRMANARLAEAVRWSLDSTEPGEG